MKLKQKSSLALLAVGCALCVGLGTFSLSQRTVGAEVIECETTATQTVKTDYIVGETLNVPSTKIVYGGNEFDPTETLVIYPDGKAVSGAKVTLDQAGNYKLVYAAKQNGKTFKAEKSFSVSPSAYSFGVAGSSIEYQEELTLATYSTYWGVYENGKWVRNEEGDIGSYDGMHLTLMSGDTFTYNKPIDLNANGGNFDFIHLYPWRCNGLVEGWELNQQANQIWIRLTDCYDPDNYVEYLINWSQKNCYYRAGASGQDSIGLMTSASVLNSGKVVYLDGMKRRVHTNTFGAYTNSWQIDKFAERRGYSFSFDVNTNKAYVTDHLSTQLINALSSELLYDKEDFFQGFTTGEVYLSIYGADWQTERMNIDITNLGGETGSSLNLEKIADEEAPLIEIENDLDSYGAIKIAVGEEYVLPNATAYDINLVGDVKTAVYLNYGKSSQTLVSSKGGKFTPNRMSTYTVEYTAKDAYGKTTVKTLELQGVKTASGLGIDFSVGKLTGLKAGVPVEMPVYTVSGLNKAVTVKTQYVRLDAGGKEVERAEIEDGSLTPYYSGTYRIVYEYTDGIKSYSYSYEVACNASDAIAMIEKPTLPEYLLKGYSYAFDKFYVYTFENGVPKAELTTMQMSMDGGDYQSVSYDGAFISASESVNIRYQYGEWISDTYSVKIVDAGTNGTLKMQELFQGDVEKSASTGFVTYATRTTGDVKLDFVNVLSLSHFYFKYDIPVGYAYFDALEITLTDYYDRTNEITFTYSVNADKQTVFTVNGADNLLNVTAFAGPVRTLFYISATQTLTELTGATLECPIDFSSDKTLLSLTLKGVRRESRVNVWEVNNQGLSSVGVDVINPEVVADKVDSGIKSLGDTITVYPISAIDVITPINAENLKVSVRGPDDMLVKDVNGVTLNGLSAFEDTYTFRAVQDGKYTIVYSFSDQAGNENFINFTATVVEQEPPTIQINEKKTTKAKLGDVVGIADYTVMDNKTATEDLISFVTVLTPNEEMLNMRGNAFKATQKGVWTVYYYCYDEAGNFNVASYRIIVE